MFDLSGADREVLMSLLADYCDGVIGEEDGARLEAMMRHYAEAPSFYVKYLALHLELGKRSKQYLDREALASWPDLAPASPMVAIWDAVSERLPSSNSFAGLVFYFVMVGALFGLATIGLETVFDRPRVAKVAPVVEELPKAAEIQVADEAPPAEAIVEVIPNDPPTPIEAPQRFAVLKPITRCEWGAENQVATNVPATDPKQEIVLESGDSLDLTSGIAEVMFPSGTRLVLDGPIRLTLASATKCEVQFGKLIADVPHEAIGFTVSTPNMNIVDLGTRFGVDVLKFGASEAHVLIGQVVVQPQFELGADAGAVGRSAQVIEAGHAVRASAEGAVQSIPADPARFILPEEVLALDLVDLVCDGDGWGHRRGVAVDPVSGRFGKLPYAQRTGDGAYHRVIGHHALDGSFIPNDSLQIDSAGHAFTFPHNAAFTWDHIRAGGELFRTNPGQRVSVLNNQDYGAAPHGMILIHSSAGLTFDLSLIRRRAPRPIRGFTAIIGNSDNMKRNPKADLFVLVDGQLRFEKRAYRRQDPLLEVHFPLEESERFLTLATTDGGDGTSGDWIIWGDPVLDLEPIP